MKGRLHEAVESLLDFGRVLSSSLASTTKSVLARVEGVTGPDGEAEIAEEQVLSVDAAVLVRPQDPSDDGAFEVAFIRRGDEAVPIGSRDTRWQVTLEKGETVLRAFGESAALLRLKPNGDVVIETSGTIFNGAATAADSFALASKVDAEFQRLWGVFNAWVVPGLDGGAALKALIPPAFAGVQPTPSARVKVDS